MHVIFHSSNLLNEILPVQVAGPESEVFAHLTPNIIKMLRDGDNEVKELAASTIAVMAGQGMFMGLWRLSPLTVSFSRIGGHHCAGGRECHCYSLRK
jgi:hypothetical protein